MSKLSIAAEWEKYRREIIPIDAPEIQRVETKRAFYAGAIAFFSGLMRMLEPGREATAGDLEMLDELNNELVQYAEDLRAGRV